MRVMSMTFGHKVAAVYDGLPKLFPIVAIVGQNRLHLVFVVGRRQENAAAPSDRRRMPAPGTSACQTTFSFVLQLSGTF